MRDLGNAILSFAVSLILLLGVAWVAGFTPDSLDGGLWQPDGDHPTNWQDAGLHPDGTAH